MSVVGGFGLSVVTIDSIVLDVSKQCAAKTFGARKGWFRLQRTVYILRSLEQINCSEAQWMEIYLWLLSRAILHTLTSRGIFFSTTVQ